MYSPPTHEFGTTGKQSQGVYLRRKAIDRGYKIGGWSVWVVGTGAIHICRSEIRRAAGSIPRPKLLSHILDNWPGHPLLPPFPYHRTSVACARDSPTPHSGSPACGRYNIVPAQPRAVMVRTLYCFILFPGCLYYMAGPASSPQPGESK